MTHRLGEKYRRPDDLLVGPYSRGEKVSIDEHKIILDALRGTNDGVMVDVGAHEGWALAPFADVGWTVYAFEPDNRNREVLLRRLANKSYKDRVRIENCCVSNESRTCVPFYTSGLSTGISSLLPFHSTHQQSDLVNTTSLSDFFFREKIERVDFLKVDTEGHDLFVLKGVPWESVRPSVICCEFENLKTERLGYLFEDLAQFLFERGYRIYVSEWHPVVEYGSEHAWRQFSRYPCPLGSTNSWGNLIAFGSDVCEAKLLETVRSRVRSKNIGAS